MNIKQLSEHIGNIDDRLVQQAEQIPNYAALHRHKKIRQFLAAAAVIVLMVSSFRVGAFAFAHEIIVEVPVEQESVEMEEIGLTLILPDRGNHSALTDLQLNKEQQREAEERYPSASLCLALIESCFCIVQVRITGIFL